MKLCGRCFGDEDESDDDGGSSSDDGSDGGSDGDDDGTHNFFCFLRALVSATTSMLVTDVDMSKHRENRRDHKDHQNK